MRPGVRNLEKGEGDVFLKVRVPPKKANWTDLSFSHSGKLYEMYPCVQEIFAFKMSELDNE
jgi:hypothetical protein